MTLRPVRPDDSGFLYSWRMDDSSRNKFLDRSKVSFAQHEIFMEKHFSEAKDIWVVYEDERGDPVGAMALYKIDGDVCEWGRIVIDPSRRGKGYGRKMLTEMMQLCVKEEFRSVFAEVLYSNKASIKLHRSLGFQPCGDFVHEKRDVARLRLTLDPINVLKPLYRKEDVLAEIEECLEVGWTGLGYKTEFFENQWKEYTKLPHAHFVNSGTAALHLALELLKRQRGWRGWFYADEVITTPMTFVSTNHAIRYAGLNPVFADIDDTLCLNPNSVESKINRNTRAIMYVGVGGNPGNWEEIRAIADRNDLAVIVDAAHMAGTIMPGGYHAGHGADAACFSFHSVKNLPTADSGMVCFADQELDERAREMSWLGISKDTYRRSRSDGKYKWKYDVESIGYKCHGNSIMAAMGIAGLKYLDFDNLYRQELANLYDELLAGTAVSRVLMEPNGKSSRHLYQVYVEDRDDVMLELNKANIFPGVHYDPNTNYQMYSGNCPFADWISERLISLPLHCRMNPRDVDRVVGVLRTFV